MHLETAQLAAIRLQAQYFSDHIADTVWSVMIKIVPRPRNLENLQPLLGRGPDCNLSERREYNLVRCLALFPGYVHEARAPWQAQPTLDRGQMLRRIAGTPGHQGATAVPRHVPSPLGQRIIQSLLNPSFTCRWLRLFCPVLCPTIDVTRHEAALEAEDGHGQPRRRALKRVDSVPELGEILLTEHLLRSLEQLSRAAGLLHVCQHVQAIIDHRTSCRVGAEGPGPNLPEPQN
mmetsp:Transcript_131659/g.421205  ORF Transcript_131659/g.421205 Transcript_131659/m.421205 type:complete len:233 (+) Transcript_131659:272-970(+)